MISNKLRTAKANIILYHCYRSWRVYIGGFDTPVEGFGLSISEAFRDAKRRLGVDCLRTVCPRGWMFSRTHVYGTNRPRTEVWDIDINGYVRY